MILYFKLSKCYIILEFYFYFPVNNPVCIYLFKVNSGNTRLMCNICSKSGAHKNDLIIFIYELNFTFFTVPFFHVVQMKCLSVVLLKVIFIVNFEHILHIVLLFPLLL